jgi:hypothetical protein
MARTYKLEHFAKGTGAAVVPEGDGRGAEAPERGGLNTVPVPPRPGRARAPGERTATALPAGHVRKKATGEIGKVQSIDPKAGTAVVLWLRQGRASTVPLTAVSRR